MATNSRFRSASEVDIQDILNGKSSKSTERTIWSATNIFRTFLAENGCSRNFEDFEKTVLNDKLRLFFASIKKQGKNPGDDGGSYKKNAYVNLRYGLSKFIKKQLGWDISDDPDFISSHEVFSAVCTKLKKSGYGETSHYPPIEKEDLQKLYSNGHHAFDVNTPLGLFQKVWFEVFFYLCRRGRENARDMTRDTFQIAKDATGREYVFQAIGEHDKNHTANDAPDDTIGEGKSFF